MISILLFEVGICVDSWIPDVRDEVVQRIFFLFWFLIWVVEEPSVSPIAVRLLDAFFAKAMTVKGTICLSVNILDPLRGIILGGFGNRGLQIISHVVELDAEVLCHLDTRSIFPGSSCKRYRIALVSVDIEKVCISQHIEPEVFFCITCSSLFQGFLDNLANFQG